MSSIYGAFNKVGDAISVKGGQALKGAEKRMRGYKPSAITTLTPAQHSCLKYGDYIDFSDAFDSDRIQYNHERHYDNAEKYHSNYGDFMFSLGYAKEINKEIIKRGQHGYFHQISDFYPLPLKKEDDTGIDWNPYWTDRVTEHFQFESRFADCLDMVLPKDITEITLYFCSLDRISEKNSNQPPSTHAPILNENNIIYEKESSDPTKDEQVIINTARKFACDHWEKEIYIHNGLPSSNNRNVNPYPECSDICEEFLESLENSLC
tara:strand:+ start:718 stop:1509 length:792 start_codon:yes stop_codon:yes gene_type:complete